MIDKEGKLSRRAYIGLLGLIVLLLCNALFGYLVVRSNRESTDRIQEQRARSILSNCQDTNRRNRETAAIINAQAARRSEGASAETKATVEATRAYTILLIEFRVFKFTREAGSL